MCMTVISLVFIHIFYSSFDCSVAYDTKSWNMEMPTKGIPLDKPPEVHPQLGEMFYDNHNNC